MEFLAQHQVEQHLMYPVHYRLINISSTLLTCNQRMAIPYWERDHLILAFYCTHRNIDVYKILSPNVKPPPCESMALMKQSSSKLLTKGRSFLLLATCLSTSAFVFQHWPYKRHRQDVAIKTGMINLFFTVSLCITGRFHALLLWDNLREGEGRGGGQKGEEIIFAWTCWLEQLMIVFHFRWISTTWGSEPLHVWTACRPTPSAASHVTT